MDENRNLAREVGGQVNKADKQQRDTAKRKKRIKRLIKYAPILLWVLGISIPVIIFLAAISNNLDKKTAMTSKQANLGAVNFSTSATEETSPNRIIVDVNERNTDGAYELSYEFKDKDENVLTQEDALEKIKLDLLKENGDLDLSKFSDSELNIIGALMYNGLKIEQYNEEELKALVIFLKADIAGQSFDLRPKEQIGQAVTLNDLRENDNVYGTLQVQRVKIEEANGVLGYKEELLEYIPYGDETTPNTFSYMVKNNDSSVLNNFTINENGELLYAKSSTTNITYSYSLNGASISIEEAQAIIPEENFGEEIHETNITASTPIDYKSRIKTYTASYGLLSDLLETTKNVDFCLELAQVALNSKIVININEETTITNETEIATYDQTTLLYDYVTYEISGTDSNTTTKTTELDRGNERPSESQSPELRKSGWNSSMTPTSSQGSSQGATLTYNWTHNGNNYTLIHTSNRYGNTWVLKREDKITTENSSVLEKNDEGHLINNYTEPSLENEPYTAKEEITYTIQKDTYIVNNTCSLDLGEIDTWYAKLKYNYNTPIIDKTKPEGYNTKGSYSELSEGVEVPGAEIEQDPHVLDFQQNKKNTYRNKYDEVTCKVTGLTIKQRVKTDVTVTYDSESSSIRYKFGENITEGRHKNIIYENNQKKYTSYIEENGVEVPEIGFLYIYNKYITAGVDLYLQNDSEEKLFELLETDPETGTRNETSESTAIKWMLFVYDGIDRGVTELKLTIVDLNNLNGVKGSALENYLKAWENYDLWKYETGQTGIFPSQSLTEDEMNYIVYEDGSEGHNNISYGMATFISTNEKNAKVTHPEYGTGYYNWKEYFSNHGVKVEELYEGAYVNKQIADDVFEKDILDYFIRIVERELGKEPLSKYEFSQAQKDALTAICYQYGNLLGFAEAYENSLNEEGLIDAEKLKKNYSRFNYTGIVENRKYANWLLFTQETYIDKKGNEIKSLGGDILKVAKAIDNYMAENQYYYCLNGLEKSRDAHRAAGLYNCGLANTFEASQKPGNNGYRLTCCATYVSWVLQELEYIQNHVDGCDALIVQLENNSWIEINDYASLQPGDIVFFDTDGDFSDFSDHVEIFVEESSSGKYLYYGAGSNDALKDYEPREAGSKWTFYKAYRKP